MRKICIISFNLSRLLLFLFFLTCLFYSFLYYSILISLLLFIVLLNAFCDAFNVLCKALWVVLCMKSAIQINLPCLALPFNVAGSIRWPPTSEPASVPRPVKRKFFLTTVIESLAKDFPTFCCAVHDD